MLDTGTRQGGPDYLQHCRERRCPYIGIGTELIGKKLKRVANFR
jgi:hypothetical protein